MTVSLWWRQVHAELGAVSAPPQAEQSQLLGAPCGGPPSFAVIPRHLPHLCVQRQEEVLG